MKLNELLLEYLQEEGFRPQVDESDGEIMFKFEGLGFSYMPDENDDLYFALRLPAIYDVDEDNREQVLEACNKTCMGMKVAKVFIVNDKSVWAVFEILFDSTPVMKDVVPRALYILRDTRAAFYKNLQD